MSSRVTVDPTTIGKVCPLIHVLSVSIITCRNTVYILHPRWWTNTEDSLSWVAGWKADLIRSFLRQDVFVITSRLPLPAWRYNLWYVSIGSRQGQRLKTGPNNNCVCFAEIRVYEQEVIVVPILLLASFLVTLVFIMLLRFCPEKVDRIRPQASMSANRRVLHGIDCKLELSRPKHQI